jgi:hypothetical protein
MFDDWRKELRPITTRLPTSPDTLCGAIETEEIQFGFHFKGRRKWRIFCQVHAADARRPNQSDRYQGDTEFASVEQQRNLFETALPTGTAAHLPA